VTTTIAIPPARIVGSATSPTVCFETPVIQSVTIPGCMEITELLAGVRRGDREALNRLVPLVNAELRRLARSRLRGERSGHTFQPTDLIHEAYLRLLQGSQPEWESRAHFFSVAARLMRQILTDHARAQFPETRLGCQPHPRSRRRSGRAKFILSGRAG
jgi:RNA polymerase sigma factor (TIGR02999 family)